MKPIISKNLTPLPPFPTREGGFQSLSPLRGEVWRGVCLYIKTFQTPSKLKYNHIQKLKGEFFFAHPGITII